MPETLKDLVVTPDDIDRGYARENQILNEWRFMMHAIRESSALRPRDIMRKKGIRHGDKGWRTVYDHFDIWIRKRKIPYSAQTILTLHEIGIFPPAIGSEHEEPMNRLIDGDILPFDFQNPKLLPINALSCHEFWRGTLSAKPGSTSKHFSLDATFADSVIQNLLKNVLGKDARLCAKLAPYLYIDALRARFFVALGIPDGEKNQTGIALPRQVELALNTIATETSSETEVELAQNIIRDFVLSFFYADKCTNTESRGFSGIIQGSVHPDVAEKRIKGFLSAIEIARFDTRLRVQRIVPGYKNPSYPEGTKLHSAIIYFKGIDELDIERFKAEFRLRIERSIK